MDERESSYEGGTEGVGFEPPTRSRGGSGDGSGDGQPPKRAMSFKTFGCIGVLGAVVVIVVAVAVAGNKSPSSGSPAASSTGTAAQPDAGSSYTSVPIYAMPSDPSPSVNPDAHIVIYGTTSAPAAPAQVTYACTGSAPDGVDITYGTDSSNSGASHLPFTKTVTLDTSVQYYVVTAQLSGSGSVTCTTVLDRGDGSSVTASGTANGGYNIASAQICSTFDGGWEKC